MPKKKQRSRKARKRRNSCPAAQKVLLIYHDMAVYENFERCARRIFEVVRNAQRQMPGKPRHLLLRVQGHRNGAGGFDRHAMAVIQDFAMEFLLPFLTEVTTPFHTIRNARKQRDDLPHELVFEYPKDAEGFWYDVDLLALRPRETSGSSRRTPPTLKAVSDYLGMDPGCLVCWGTPVDRAHAVPSSLGGSMDVRNFALLCRDHHRQAPDIADAEAFWAWVDYAEIRDSGSKWAEASEEVREWVRAHGARTGPKDRSELEFLAAVRFELQHLCGWSDVEFADMSWDLLAEYHHVLDAATGKHFGAEKKGATHAWAYHIARRRLAKRHDASATDVDVPPRPPVDGGVAGSLSRCTP